MESSVTQLHLGCGRTILKGWINLDCFPLPGVDIVADLDDCENTPLPFDDNSIDVILGNHLIEHIRKPLPLMQELYRIARPGALATFAVPYGSSDDAFEDPTHVRQYFLQSFGYFSQPYYWRADYGYRGDWRTTKLTLRVSGTKYREKTHAEIMQDVLALRNVVHEMTAELVAVKPARPPQRDLQIWPQIDFLFD
jgi:SAM-dependent methyltransferase